MHTSLFSYNEIYPVLLTKGWLIKLGFKDVSKKQQPDFIMEKQECFMLTKLEKMVFYERI